MNRRVRGVVLSTSILLLFVAQFSPKQTYGEPVPGVLHGTTLDASGAAVPQAVVRVRSTSDSADRIVTSDARGNFLIEGLAPGRYQLVASKKGFAGSQVVYLAIAAGDLLTFNMRLGERTEVLASDAVSNTAASTADPSVSSDLAKELEAMKERIEELEAKLQATPAPAPAAELSATLPVESSSLAIAAAQGQAPPETLKSGNTSDAAAPAAPVFEAEKTTKSQPFAFADWTWLNGNPRTKDTPLATKYFTPEFRADANFTEDANQPKDHSLGGSTETFREGEVQLEQLSFGGDLRLDNVRGRVLTMFGMFASTTPRNDGSAGVGQWDLNTAYRYVSEAWGGYHFDVNHGLNIDAGIFVSYIGLFSYYNFDNWAYQPSYVSSNTPWFFNGVRIQWFPTDKLKIEPWIINGWQSYAKFNGHPGLGGQILYRPKPWLSMVFNNYGMGTDTLGVPGRSRIHTDDSVEVKYFDHPENYGLDKMAFSLTGDLGCEYGGTQPGTIVSCHNNSNGHPKQSFAGWMLYNRFWFDKDKYAVTLGGGAMDNPGRYLTLVPPINGATAVSGTPYFPGYPGAPMKAWDSTVTFDYMPSQFITFRFETGYRYSSVPYWTGRQGITPPGGNVAPVAYNGTVGTAGSYICTNGTTSAVSSFSPSGFGFTADNVGGAVASSCLAQYGSGWSAWQPDLRKTQLVSTIAIMVKF